MNRPTDRLAELLEAETPRGPQSRDKALLLAIFAFVLWAIIWASFAPLDEVTRGFGEVVPAREAQLVQSLEGGIVSEILVREGDRVAAGDVLLRIDDVLFASEARAMTARLQGLQARQARLQAEADGIAPAFPPDLIEAAPAIVATERQLYETRLEEQAEAISVLENQIIQTEAEIAAIRAQIGQLTTNLALSQEELAITEGLVKSGAASQVERIQLTQERNDLSGSLSAAREGMIGLEAQLAARRGELAQQRAAFRGAALQELNEVQIELQPLVETLVSRSDRVRRTELRAPTAGIVQRLTVKTVGGVVEPAMTLVEIIPVEDDLFVRARVRPADIGFLSPGQPVRVKITAYDSELYGSLPGVLERISPDTVTDADGAVFYEVDVRTERADLSAGEAVLPIIPGMLAEIDVLTGKRSVMSYLVRPVSRTLSRALSES